MLGKIVIAVLVLLALGLLVVSYEDDGLDAEFGVPSAEASAAKGSGSGWGSGSGFATSARASASFADGRCSISASQEGSDYEYSVSCAAPEAFTWRGASFVGCSRAVVEWPPSLITPQLVSGGFRDMRGYCGPGIVTAHITLLDGTPLDVALSLATNSLVTALPLTS